jgi:putative membrane protein
MDVRIETGGGAETEAVLRVVDSRALEEIRAAVFAERLRDATTAAASPAAAETAVLLAMSPRDLGVFGLIHGYGMLVAAAVFGILSELGLVDRAASTFGGTAGRGFLRRLARAVFDDGPMPVAPVLTGIAIAIVVLVILRLLSAFWMAVKYWGFKLTRGGDDLRCEYGLLTRVAATIPVRRIQKITVREGPWHRLAGRVSVKVQTAGGSGRDEESGRTPTWIAPLVSHAGLPRLINAILPDLAADVEWQGVNPRGARREFVQSLIVLIPLSGFLLWTFGWRAILAVPILLAWSAFHSRRTVAALRWGLSENALHFASGWIWRHRLAAPLTKLQVVARHESPFDRRHGMRSVSADTAGSHASEYSISIPYLAAPVATELSKRLSLAAARTAFRW